MTTPDRIRWGILSTGHIAHVVTDDLVLLPDECQVVAVASRSIDKATDFARHYGLARAYGSYAELAADPDVDVVYVATPHSEHLAAAELCLNAGKHVLCEKPLTVSAAETGRLLTTARDHGVFLMEAVWTRTNPLIRQVAALVRSGELGDVRAVHAQFAFRFEGDGQHRLLNPALGGGAILDLGVYPVHIINLVAGEPTELSAYGTLRHTGVDGHTAAVMHIPGRDGRPPVVATALTSLDVTARTQCEILLTRGRITIDEFIKPERVIVERPDASADTGWTTEELVTRLSGHGYTFQAQEVHACLREGRSESPLVPWADTLAVARTLDRWRAALG